MAGKHTPAPWAVVPYGDGDSLAVHDARGDWRVCFMATPSKDGDFEGIEANARLIAAAPELLEALEGIFAKLDDGPSAPGHGHSIPGIWDDDVSNGERAGKPCEWCTHWERARAAIAKAKGEDGEASNG